MNLRPPSLALLFFCFLTTFTSAGNDPTHFNGDVSINCCASGISGARNGREWRGDSHGESSPLLQMKGFSTTSNVVRGLIAGDDPVPYRTARISRSRFSYAFRVKPGQKIIRLHFNSAPYKGFPRFKDLFDVEAGAFTLLGNFSASLTADALGVGSFVKEFWVNIEESQLLKLIFSPASGQLLDSTYAFINGIEIIFVPPSRSYVQVEKIGVQVVGKSSVCVDKNTAFEIVGPLNVKQDSVSSSVNDASDEFGTWGTVPKRKADMNNNITWRVSVDVGFRYLVRLYFSELGFKMAEAGGLEVHINEMLANTSVDIFRERDDSVAWYRDYMVMMEGNKKEGKIDLRIYLESTDEFREQQVPLEGFEVMKLSNPDNSLASPNPMLKARDSSYQTIKNLIQVLGHRNAVVSFAVTVLCLVNVIIYPLPQIWVASGIEEENIPSARAERLCRRFSLAEIQLATRNFSDGCFIGRGGFGKVYKGLLDDGKHVAIKRLKSNSRQGAREFLTEIETLTELRHINLVSLIGYCNERKEMILVYEYMSCGTLADHLYKLARNSDNGSSLTWTQRLNICIGAGRGLDYLHTVCSLIHRDVKASNILLDEDLVPKVSDFGLAKHLTTGKLQSYVSTEVKGTFGYLDPDYLTTRRLTRKSDIYGFGVVMLEVLTGRPAVDQGVPVDEQILIKWAKETISEGKAEQIVASNLRGQISRESLKEFLDVAVSCLHDEPKKRPTMAKVVLQLEFALEQNKSLISRLYCLLDMYEVPVALISDAVSDVDALFPEEIGSLVRIEFHELLTRLGESTKTIIKEFGSHIASCSSTIPYANGGIHPLTKYVINYILCFAEYGDTLNLLLQAQDRENSDGGQSISCAVATRLQSFISILEANLDSKSNLYKDSPLKHIFMMNNIHYMVRKIRNSKVSPYLGDDWVKSHIVKYRQHAIQYERVTWSSILPLLRDDGKAGKATLKTRCRAFTAAFEDVYRIQTRWCVPDLELREDLRISASKTVIMAYRNFVSKITDSIGEKHIKYTEQELATYILDLLEGSPKSLNHLMKR